MFNNATSGYSLADIAAATGTNRNDNGFGFGGDGGAWWIIILFLFCFAGWGGNGNGLFGGGSTGSGITDGYILTSDFANIERKIDNVDSGLCDGFYAMNTGMLYYKESIRKKKRNVPMDYYDRYEDEDEREYPIKIYDSREGKSPERRRMYMESKELHHDQAKKLKELEEYMQELNADILEMIEGASQEEKQLLQKKIALLATKINV